MKKDQDLGMIVDLRAIDEISSERVMREKKFP